MQTVDTARGAGQPGANEAEEEPDMDAFPAASLADEVAADENDDTAESRLDRGTRTWVYPAPLVPRITREYSKQLGARSLGHHHTVEADAQRR
jgi:hypothetical protein